MNRKKFMILLCIFALMHNAYAQQDEYVSKGMQSVSRGDYSDAASQFKAAIAVLKIKKTDPLSSEFIQVEKYSAYATECLQQSNSFNKTVAKLSDNSIQKAYEQCNDENAAVNVEDSLLTFVSSAKKNLARIHSRFPSDISVEKNQKSINEIEKKIKSFRDNFSETLAWRSCMDAGTVESYSDFLKKYPNGNYRQSALNSISNIKDEEYWNRIKAVANEEVLMGYLSNFPQGKYSLVVKERLNTIRENKLWAEIEYSYSPERYKEFINRFPNSKHIKEAKQLLKESKDISLFEAKKKINTIKAYNEYLRTYPKGLRSAEAKKCINRIKEKSYWESVVAKNTIQSYSEYLIQSKSQAYAEEAETAISDLKREADQELWEKTTATNTTQAYSSFITHSYFADRKEAARANSIVVSFPNVSASELLEMNLYEFGSLKSKNKYLESLIIEKNIDLYKRLEEAYEYKTLPSTAHPNYVQKCLNFIKKHPEGKLTISLKDKLAVILADRWEYLPPDATTDQLKFIKQFCYSTTSKDYIEKKIAQNKNIKKKITAKGYAKYKGSSYNGGDHTNSSYSKDIRLVVKAMPVNTKIVVDKSRSTDKIGKIHLNYGYHTVDVTYKNKSRRYVFYVGANSTTIYLPAISNSSNVGTVIGYTLGIAGGVAGVAAAIVAKSKQQ